MRIHLNMNNLKYEIIMWLNQPIDETRILFDFVIELFDDLLIQLNNDTLKLRQEENILLINFIYFLYSNSDTRIKLI